MTLTLTSLVLAVIQALIIPVIQVSLSIILVICIANNKKFGESRVDLDLAKLRALYDEARALDKKTLFRKQQEIANYRADLDISYARLRVFLDERELSEEFMLFWNEQETTEQHAKQETTDVLNRITKQ